MLCFYIIIMSKSCYVRLKIVQIIFFYLYMTQPNPIRQRRMNFKTAPVKNRRYYGANQPIICGIDSYEDDMYGCQEDPDYVATTQILEQPSSECTTQSQDKIINTKTTPLQQSNTHSDIDDPFKPLNVDDETENAKATAKLQPLDRKIVDSGNNTDTNTTTKLPSSNDTIKSNTTTEAKTTIEDNTTTKVNTTTEANITPTLNTTTAPTTDSGSIVTQIYWYSESSPASYPTLPIDKDLCVRAKCEYVDFLANNNKNSSLP